MRRRSPDAEVLDINPTQGSVVRWQDTRLSFKVCWAPARSAEALRRRRADLPVVLASSYAAPMLTERAGGINFGPP